MELIRQISRMDNMGLGSWIERRCRMTPWKTAIIHKDNRRSYEEFQARIGQLANGLHCLGVHRGDRIGYLGPNHPAFLETMFAVGTLGAVFVPLHYRFSLPDLIHVLNNSGCSIVIHDAEAAPIIASLRPSVGVREYVMVGDKRGESHSLQSVCQGQSPVFDDISVGLNDLCLLSYTSGTTGKPKGVMLSHGNLTWNVFNFMSCSDFLSDDVILTLAPLYRMGGLGVSVLPGLFKGATVVVTPQVDPDGILDLIDRHGVTVLFGSPSLFRALLDAHKVRKTNLSSLRFCICGGDTVPESLIEGWLDLDVQFQQGYGLTEAAPLVLLLDKEEILSKNGSAGRPAFFTDVRVVDPEMNDIGEGQSGEIVVRGPNVTQGYWNDPTRTEATVTADGWLHTGDAAHLDSDRDIYVIGRIRDAIPIEGQQVFPSEIEKKLYDHPDILDSAVAGFSDQNKNLIVAFIVPKAGVAPSSATLLDFCRGVLPPQLVPDRIIFVDDLPRNPNGKIIRWKLKEYINS